jgi:HAD superfamily hydrolase (TIGR01509 family)
MLKAVLCDLDGTLLDSNGLHAEAWQRTFEHFDYKVTFDEALHQIGKGGDQLVPVFVPEKDRERLQKPIEEYRKELFHAEYFDKVRAFPDARQLLQKMKERGLRIAIASSASKEDLERLKNIADITDLVEKETSSDDAGTSKPAPDIFQAALNRLHIEASESLALGDTPWDIQAGLKAGIKTVAVTCGGWTEQQLKDAGAIEVYQDPMELKQRFDTSAFMRDGK